MATLQQRLARGDPLAFAEFYDAVARRVGHYLLVYLGSQADAEDALQETFLRLARNKRKLAKVESLAAYVFTVARNEAVRLAKRKSRRQREQPLLAAEELFCDASNEHDAELREVAETVAAALAQLSAEQREVVELKTYGQLTFQQISAVTGLPQGTAASRYRSAMIQMQEWFARQPR
jgi:RNA polymerase sigma-70 factor, ECF subfamily